MPENPYQLNLNKKEKKKFPSKIAIIVLAAILIPLILINILLFTNLSPKFLNPVKDKFANSITAEKLVPSTIQSKMPNGETKFSSPRNRCSLTLPPNWEETEPLSESVSMFFVNDSTKYGIDFKAFLSVSMYIDIGTELPTRVFRNYQARLVQSIKGTVIDNGYKLFDNMTCKWFLIDSPMSEQIQVVYYLIVYENRLYVLSCEAKKEIFENHINWLTAPMETFRVLDEEMKQNNEDENN